MTLVDLLKYPLESTLVDYQGVTPSVEVLNSLESVIDNNKDRIKNIIDLWSLKKELKKEEEEESNIPKLEFVFTQSDKKPTKSTIKKAFKTTNEWMNAMIEAYKKEGLNDDAIRNLLAKNALESSWGNSAQGAYNYGNLTPGKYWKGDIVDGKDHDALGNEISLKFRSYNSLLDYVKDEIDFLTRLYEFNPNDDFNTFINKLQGGNKDHRKYALADNYADSVRNVYNSLVV